MLNGTRTKAKAPLQDANEIQHVQDTYIAALMEGEGLVDAAWYTDRSYSTILRLRQESRDFEARVQEHRTS